MTEKREGVMAIKKGNGPSEKLFTSGPPAAYEVYMLQKARTILKETFGYENFRPLQEKIILSVMAKRDNLVLMPTGGGKSLCYQIPALLFPGLTVVVSPLISLMKDQADQLRQLGVPAVMLNSSLDIKDYQEALRNLREKRVKLLYAAPETLLKPEILRLLSTVTVDCVAIDEAHCISEWGHDFRPEYRQLAGLRERFPGAAFLALTATATERVREDIAKNLGFREPDRHVASFNRENLFYQVLPKQNPFAQLERFLDKFPRQSGIVYCFSRNAVDGLARRLAERGFSVRPYHAGLADEIRQETQELFLRDEVQIIVATIAFGMGVHKSNIRFVVHYDLPKSVESYYQETGRAGRDGLPAHCLLLYSYSDIQKIRYFIDQKENETERQVSLRHLEALVRYAESTVCRRLPLIRYFGEDYLQEHCGACDNCQSGGEEQKDMTEEAKRLFACVAQLKGRFGLSQVIDVLRGSGSQKVFLHGHEDLPAYGSGKDLSKKAWQHLAGQCLRGGFLFRDEENYATIRLTPLDWQVLACKEQVLVVPLEEETSSGSGRGGSLEGDQDLFEKLRKKRKELADAANVPAYIIFSDRTLADMASARPRDRASLLGIHGVGKQKLENYGQDFLKIIEDHCKC